MRLGQNGGVGGFAKELDQEIHADRAVEDAGAQRGQGLRQASGGGIVDGCRSAKSLPVLATGMSQNGIVKIVRGENLASIGRPAHTQFVEEIRGNFHQSCLNQHLVGGRIQFLDQLQDLREEVDIGGDQYRVAALVGHCPDPAHQVADGSGRGPAVRCSRAIWLATQPGIVAFFLGFLFQIKAAPGGAARLLLRLGNGARLSRLRDRPQGRGAVSGKEDVQAIGHGRGLGKFEAEAQGGFAGLGRTVQLFNDVLDRRQTFLCVGGDDQRIRIGLAGDAHLAVKPADVAVRGGLGRRIVIEVIPVRALRLFLQEELIENIFDVHGADVFQRVDSRREALIADGLVEFVDDLGDVVHLCRRGLHNERVAPPVGHHAHLSRGLAGGGREIIDIPRIGGLFLVELLQLLGHVLRIRVLEWEGPGDFLLGVLGVKRGGQILDDLEIGFTRQNDQGIGLFVR